jgi:hypothetical protein
VLCGFVYSDALLAVLSSSSRSVKLHDTRCQLDLTKHWCCADLTKHWCCADLITHWCCADFFFFLGRRCDHVGNEDRGRHGAEEEKPRVACEKKK